MPYRRRNPWYQARTVKVRTRNVRTRAAGSVPTSYASVARRHRTLAGTKYAGTLSVPRNYGRYASLVGAPMPDRFNTSLIYSDTITIDPAAGALGSHLFRLNSLYDPDFTGIGHQPRGFDQMMAFYQKYRVYGCKIDVCCLGPGVSALNNGKWAVLVQGSSTGFLWSQYALEEHASRISPVYQGSNGVETDKARFSGMVWLKHLYQCKDLEDDTTAEGTASSDPARVALMHLVYSARNGTDNPDTITFQVTLTYYATFFKNVSPSAS